MGDRGISHARLNDVWSSTDGISWTEVSSEANFSPRQSHQCAVFDNRLWLIGGNDSSRINDVWSSIDGKNWVEEVSRADFSERNKHQVVTFNDKLWMIGGYDGNILNEVWSSWNGTDWRRPFKITVSGELSLY